MLNVVRCTYGRTVVSPNFFGLMGFYYLSHKLQCYTGISGPVKSRNNTREKISYFFMCVDKANQLLIRRSPFLTQVRTQFILRDNLFMVPHKRAMLTSTERSHRNLEDRKSTNVKLLLTFSTRRELSVEFLGLKRFVTGQVVLIRALFAMRMFLDEF